MAAAYLRRALEARDVDAHVQSAGTLSWGGPASDYVRTVLAEGGIDVSAHRSQPLSYDLVHAADLVLGMTRAHRGGALAYDADAADRSFVLGELVRLAEQVGGRRGNQSVREWLAMVASLRPVGEPPARASDEVDDPVGEPIEVYRRVATRLDDLTSTLAKLL
jgi:protein-tyrosine phosphatase